MQSFAIAHAKLCDSTCKALRWHLQSFALADAMLCVGDGQNCPEIVSPALDKRIGRKGTTEDVKPRSDFSFPTYGATASLLQKV